MVELVCKKCGHEIATDEQYVELETFCNRCKGILRKKTIFDLQDDDDEFYLQKVIGFAMLKSNYMPKGILDPNHYLIGAVPVSISDYDCTINELTNLTTNEEEIIDIIPVNDCYEIFGLIDKSYISLGFVFEKASRIDLEHWDNRLNKLKKSDKIMDDKLKITDKEINKILKESTDEELIDSISYPLLHPEEYPELKKKKKNKHK